MARARRLQLAGLAVALAAVGAACGSGGNATSTTAAAPTTPPQPSVGCPLVSAPKPRASEHLQPPQTRLDPHKKWIATVTTSCGSFRVELAVKVSPQTTASFAALANGRFYDHTVFHRIVPGFVIQGGDPTQTGEGGPGYTTRDVPPRSTRYVQGVVAMAKTQVQARGIAGSQFFVVTAADARLAPDYAVLGRVVSGLTVVLRIGRHGDPNTEQPTQPIVIRRIRVASR
jgi:peptidyl-prolyl cis-trans isomerase B (cyclophilin B)